MAYTYTFLNKVEQKNKYLSNNNNEKLCCINYNIMYRYVKCISKNLIVNSLIFLICAVLQNKIVKKATCKFIVLVFK